MIPWVVGRAALLPVLLLFGLASCGPTPREAPVPIENGTTRTLRVSVVDAGAAGAPRRRSVELAPGGRFAIDLRAGSREGVVRFEARTADGEHAVNREVRGAELLDMRRVGLSVLFTATDLGLDAARASTGDAFAPIAVNLAAGRNAFADEVDPVGTPASAVDDDVRCFWRGLAPPPARVSWMVDLQRPATVERLQVVVQCLQCGPIRLRVTFLREPLALAGLAAPGRAQEATILGFVDRVPRAVIDTIELTGSVDDGAVLPAHPREPIGGVRALVVTVVEAPENAGLYDVRLGGRWE